MQSKLQFITDMFWQEIARQRKSLFLWIPVMMGIGILTCFHLDHSWSWERIGFAVCLTGIATWKSWWQYHAKGTMIWLCPLLLSVAALCFLCGFASMKYRTESLGTVLLKKDRVVVMQATIEKLVPLEDGKAKRVILRDIQMLEDNDRDIAINRVRLKTYHFKGDDWNIGDIVQVKAKLMAPSAPVIPGGFDFRVKAYYEGLSAVGYTMGHAALIRKSVSNMDHIQSFRDHIAQKIYDAMDVRYAGVARALLTGEREGISTEDVENLRTAGLAHLLAISGLHIGLVAGCVFFFVRIGFSTNSYITLRYPIKKWAAVCAIIVAFSYMVLAGMTVPTVRAFIMTSLVLLAVILDRSTVNMRLVALAAIIVMLTTPEVIMGPSFVLSFAAVSALIVFYQNWGRQWFVNANAYKPLLRPVYYVLGIVATTVVATLSTAPFSILFFNHFAVYSVLSNIFAMPLMAFIVMPFGLLSILLMPLGLDYLTWSLVEWGIEQTVMIAHGVSLYEGASLSFASFGMIETFLICCGFIWFVIWQGGARFIFIPVIIFSVYFSQFSSKKHIVISEDMKSILIVDKSEDKLFLIGKVNGYIKKQWLGYFGYNNDVDIQYYNNGDKLELLDGYCDDLSCSIKMNGNRVSIVSDANYLFKACKNSDILISKRPVNDFKECKDVKIIDRFDVWRRGAAHVTTNGSKIVVNYVEK